ncbi:MAG: hypothetical protein JWM53_1463 [bacterium]|nr:hypothetical protein [bacterium]
MRPRTLLSDVQQDHRTPARPSNHDTYERVRRTLDEALAELQLPVLDRDDSSGLIKLHQPSR